MVPTFTWGLVRSNLPFAIFCSLPSTSTTKLVPIARIERATSPLPRECSTTEPYGQSTCYRHRYRLDHRDDQACTGIPPFAATPTSTHRLRATSGAGDGNRTRVISLEG